MKRLWNHRSSEVRSQQGPIVGGKVGIWEPLGVQGVCAYLSMDTHLMPPLLYG